MSLSSASMYPMANTSQKMYQVIRWCMPDNGAVPTQDSCRSGDVIVRKGQPVTRLPVVITGLAGIVLNEKRLYDGSQRGMRGRTIHGVYGCGKLPFVRNLARWVQDSDARRFPSHLEAIAHGTTVVWIPFEEVVRELTFNEDLTDWATSAILAQLITELELVAKIYDLQACSCEQRSYGTNAARIARCLFLLCEHFGVNDSGRPNGQNNLLPIRITCAGMGMIVGCSEGDVSRALTAMANSGLIERICGGVKIVSRCGLEQVGQNGMTIKNR